MGISTVTGISYAATLSQMTILQEMPWEQRETLTSQRQGKRRGKQVKGRPVREPG